MFSGFRVYHGYSQYDILPSWLNSTNNNIHIHLQQENSNKSEIKILEIATNQTDEFHQVCNKTLADGSTRFCRHFRFCILPEFMQNFTKYEEIACEIDNRYAGVCCPEDLNERFFFPTKSPQEAPSWGERPTELPLGPPPQNGGQQKPYKGCGTSSARGPLRIAGGQPANPGRWPWMAALFRHSQSFSNTGPLELFCGGSLITDRHVLTAAHCTNRMRPRDLFVRLGETDLSSTRPEGSFTVAEIRQHRSFDPSSYEHDISIIRLSKPIRSYDLRISPVCLPPIGSTWENEMAVVTGWGSSYYGGPLNKGGLREVAVPVWNQRDCTNAFAHQKLVSSVLCASSKRGGKDSCQGDSGGPLVHKLSTNGRWVLIGVVSWGIRCGEPGKPGVYTRVNSYLDWIVRNAVF
ncbi:trypsin-1-like [Ctenocephalides felis]|uniref:trypsin-1-like n=1 Tax=Ctenocephalides felis TaxID=7515 RepID=UPI000E6E2B91|nr:trypsin-1-like [Ctenocephalides felis]